MEAIVIAANETQNICFQSLQKKNAWQQVP